jgi:hypothetical protein
MAYNDFLSVYFAFNNSRRDTKRPLEINLGTDFVKNILI